MLTRKQPRMVSPTRERTSQHTQKAHARAPLPTAPTSSRLCPPHASCRSSSSTAVTATGTATGQNPPSPPPCAGWGRSATFAIGWVRRELASCPPRPRAGSQASSTRRGPTYCARTSQGCSRCWSGRRAAATVLERSTVLEWCLSHEAKAYPKEQKRTDKIAHVGWKMECHADFKLSLLGQALKNACKCGK